MLRQEGQNRVGFGMSKTMTPGGRNKRGAPISYWAEMELQPQESEGMGRVNRLEKPRVNCTWSRKRV